MEEQLFTLDNLIKINQITELYKLDENTILYKIYSKSLINLCLDWNENRVLEDERINEIIKAYKDNNKVLLSSLYRAIYDKKNKQMILIDGHHRKNALIKILEMDINGEFNPIILLIIHNYNEINELNEDILYELHINSNMSKALEEYQIPTKIRTLLINKIKKDNILSNGISKVKNTKSAHYPKMNLNELAEFAGKIIMEFPEMKRNNEKEKIIEIIDKIINNLKEINNYLSLVFRNDNFKKLRYGINKKEKERINKCFENNYYLNMKESEYSMDNWIKYITRPKEYFIELQIKID